MYSSFPFSFEGGEWNLIVLTPDHCFSIYYVCFRICGNSEGSDQPVQRGSLLRVFSFQI